MTKVRIIDPPSGWKFGFPKPVPNPAPENMLEWLVEQGYPQKLIDSYGEHFYCRHWETELDEMFCISEQMAEYEEENLEIDLDGGLSAINE